MKHLGHIHLDARGSQLSSMSLIRVLLRRENFKRDSRIFVTTETVVFHSSQTHLTENLLEVQGTEISLTAVVKEWPRIFGSPLEGGK